LGNCPPITEIPVSFSDLSDLSIRSFDGLILIADLHSILKLSIEYCEYLTIISDLHNINELNIIAGERFTTRGLVDVVSLDIQDCEALEDIDELRGVHKLKIKGSPKIKQFYHEGRYNTEILSDVENIEITFLRIVSSEE
jgi:hypothetical protein